MESLTPQQIDQFINKGFIKIENAFSAELAEECRSILWKAANCDPHNPNTWTEPVIRIGELSDEAFVQSANTTILHNAFDQLVGKGNWIPKTSLGSFPLRFPSPKPANDTGWHVDASFAGDDASNYFEWRINVHSKSRGLLMLFLFSDVSDKDAPTLIKAGSHFDVAKILEPAGSKGLSFMELAERLHTIPAKEEIAATGKAGTVYLCHPFIVHAAQNHNGTTPKFMAQPALHTKHDFGFSDVEKELCPVEKAIVIGLKAF